MNETPSASQRRILWIAITALSIAVIGSLIVGGIYLISRVLAFLQPILVPFATAAVLAYLLEPMVRRLMKWGLTRNKAVWIVFSLAVAILAGVLVLIVPVLVRQTGELYDALPKYTKTATERIGVITGKIDGFFIRTLGVDLLHPKKESMPDAPPSPANPGVNAAPIPGAALNGIVSGEWLQKEIPLMFTKSWEIVQSGLGGFLGVFGFLLSLVIVPLYLYYFLTGATEIASSWTNIIPMRSSRIKSELIITLTEMNRYLIAFFRGQLVVSMINGVATAVGLTFVGLKFGWLIGFSLCFMGIIPYLGIAICWIPAVLIALVQDGSWLISANAGWWVFPLVVTGVFAVVQQIDGFFVTPRIVGESVGLHPMTVIVSIFAWSLILGGLLGAILAVPMTAALKVIFKRYVWDRATREPVHETEKRGAFA